MNIAVLGCGNMATPIVSSIYNEFNDLNFYTYTPSKTKAVELAKKVNGKQVDSIEDFSNIDFWLIACKPQQFESLAKELRFKISKESTVISIMAAISEQKISSELNCENVIRIMPNTPSAFKEGISLYYSSNVKDQKVLNWFKSCGLVIECKSEKEFDELMTITGSGPGYVFYLANLYFNELLNLGMDDKRAREIISQLFLGSSVLMKNSEESFERLCQNVTSKGGVTEAALSVFNTNSLSTIVSNSINSAIERTKELS